MEVESNAAWSETSRTSRGRGSGSEGEGGLKAEDILMIFSLLGVTCILVIADVFLINFEEATDGQLGIVFHEQLQYDHSQM